MRQERSEFRELESRETIKDTLLFAEARKILSERMAMLEFKVAMAF